MAEKQKIEVFVLPDLPQTVFEFMRTTVQENYAGPEAFPMGRADWDANRQKYLENKGWSFTFGVDGSLTRIPAPFTVIAEKNGKRFKFAQGWAEPIQLG